MLLDRSLVLMTGGRIDLLRIRKIKWQKKSGRHKPSTLNDQRSAVVWLHLPKKWRLSPIQTSQEPANIKSARIKALQHQSLCVNVDRATCSTGNRSVNTIQKVCVQTVPHNMTTKDYDKKKDRISRSIFMEMSIDGLFGLTASEGAVSQSGAGEIEQRRGV